MKSYLEALARLFVTEELPAWRPHLRSRAELRRAPKRYFAEVKLGGAEPIEQAVSSLRRLRERIDTERMGNPAKLIVVTAGGPAFEYPDETAVVPITALAP